MGILDRLASGVRQVWPWDAAKERRLRLEDGQSWAMYFGMENAAGKSVTEQTALQLSAVFACVRATSQAVASLPLKVYRKAPNGDRLQIDDGELAAVLASPNGDQTDVEFWEMMVARVLMRGDAVALKRKTAGTLSALEPIAATPYRTPAGNLVFRVWDRGKDETLQPEEVFHIPGFHLSGDGGMSAIRYGAQSMGIAIAAEETVGKIFSNGMQSAGILTSELTLKKEQREQLQTIMSSYQGSTNAGKLMILEAGLKYQAMTLQPEDAELLASRRFNIEDICRWFGVPPIVVGHSADGQTMWGTGVEQILLSWLVLGINPLAKRIEGRIRKSLIAPELRRTVYAEFLREALLEMDSKAKAAFLSSMTQNGMMSRNEGRAKLNMAKSDQEGMDDFTVQSALVPIDKLGVVKSAPAAPADPSAPPAPDPFKDPPADE